MEAPNESRWRQIAFGVIPAVLFFVAWTSVSSTHFAAWDVMEDVASTSATAQIIRALMAPIAVVAVASSWVVGSLAFARRRHEANRYHYGLTIGFGALFVVAAVATGGFADDQIYPLRAESVDIVPLHSLFLVVGLAIAPLATAKGLLPRGVNL